MKSEIQNTKFSHGHCFKCGHVSKIDKFEQQRKFESKSEKDGCTMEMYQIVLICPLCGDEFCEALFPNEVN